MQKDMFEGEETTRVKFLMERKSALLKEMRAVGSEMEEIAHRGNSFPIDMTDDIYLKNLSGKSVAVVQKHRGTYPEILFLVDFEKLCLAVEQLKMKGFHEFRRTE